MPHFFFSQALKTRQSKFNTFAETENQRYKTFAEIDGKIVEYNIMQDMPEIPEWAPDAVYLGEGGWHHQGELL